MFGFPQALDEQDMDVGAESEQAMLPSSLSMEYQGSKPKAAIHGFDMNSGLSVCEHLRGEMEQGWKFKNSTVMTLKGTRVISFPAFLLSLILSSFPIFLCISSIAAVIPRVTRHLLSNPVFSCITLAACMEIAVVAGFAAFLGKYLEQQFNLTTSSANQLLGRPMRDPT